MKASPSLARARHQPRGEGGEQERPAGGVEGKRGSRPAGDESGQGGGCALRQHASRLDPDRRLRPLATRRALPPRGTKLLGQRGRRRPPSRVDRERVIDGGDEALGKIGSHLADRRSPGLDHLSGLERRRAPERVMAGERLPEKDSNGPDVSRRAGGLPVQALRRDVRQRSGHVADGGQRLGVGELREPEVEQPHRDLVPVDDEDVRRLDVAMHDATGMRKGKRFEDLGRRLDCALVSELTRA